MKRKELLVPVNPATESVEYKKVESLFLQTLSGERKITKVLLQMYFKKAHLLAACEVLGGTMV